MFKNARSAILLAVAALTATRLSAEDKLDALRRLDEFRFWLSLDDRRYCERCKHIINGRQIEIIELGERRGAPHLHCPTAGCISAPSDWIYADPIAVAAGIGHAVQAMESWISMPDGTL
ncbi:MAG: hypothetical protein ABI871_08145 [Chthoniobacterales bacterium]